MEYNEAVVDYWREHYIDEKTKLCSLCENTGIILNTTHAVSSSGIRIARANYCICPNGQTARQNVITKGRQLGRNHHYLNLGGEIDEISKS